MTFATEMAGGRIFLFFLVSLATTTTAQLCPDSVHMEYKECTDEHRALFVEGISDTEICDAITSFEEKCFDIYKVIGIHRHEIGLEPWGFLNSSWLVC